jgi:hypothetical protein
LAGGGSGTSSLPRFLDGSLDAMRLLEEDKNLLDSLLVTGDGGVVVSLVSRLTKFLAGQDLY